MNVAVTSATSAWSAWVSTVSGQGAAPAAPQAVQRWDGTAWRPVAVPASLVPHVRTAVSVASDSASEAWIFSWKYPSQALRYDDGRWSLQQIPSWVIRTDADKRLGITSAAFSPTDLWVFSLGIDADGDRYAAHYDGHSWTKVALPGIPGEVSAVSATDIWALDVTAGSVGSSWSATRLMHYDGRGWSVVALPAVRVAAGATVGYGNLTAAGPGDAWLARTVTQAAGTEQTTLLHLSGTTWTTVRQPSGAGLLVVSAAADGAGGLWAAAVYANPGGFVCLSHFSGGTWSQLLNDHSNPTLAWIPGTTQVWGFDGSGAIYRG